VLLVTVVAATTLPRTPIVHLAGAIVMLALPAFHAWRRRALRPLGPEVLLAGAFYLSMYHAPLLRTVLGTGQFRTVELEVMEMGLYASWAVSLILSLRAGAYAPGQSHTLPLPDLEPHAARFDAYAGLGVTAIGFLFLGSWIIEVGVGQLLTAQYGEVYLYARNAEVRTTVAFQGTFVMTGIATMARALARWPEPGPSRALRVVYVLAFLLYAGIYARLGARGPTIETALVVFLARADTRRPVSWRTVALFAGAFAVLYVSVTAMRQRLGVGVEGTTADDIVAQGRRSVDGDSPGEFDALFQNHVMIVELTGAKLPYSEGKSYLDIPAQLVPRQIIEEKPIALSAWWIEYIDPIGARFGSGRCFGTFTEGYLNFGIVGGVGEVAIVTLLLLMIFRWLPAGTVGVGPAAVVTLAHAYYWHRCELVAGLVYIRNAVLVALAAVLIRQLVGGFAKRARALGSGLVAAPAESPRPAR
jgi:hypothetical protein